MPEQFDAYVPQVRRVLWVTLLLNLSVIIVKVVIGLAASSLAILSDAVHSGADSLNNLLGLLIMAMVRPKADQEHPYGHAKFEFVGALGVAAFMLLTFYGIVSRAIERLTSPAPAGVQVTPLIVVIFSLTIISNLLVIWYERHEGKRLSSQLLLADVKHTQTDLVTTLAVITGLILVVAGYPMVDTLLGLVVAAFVAFTAYRVVRDSVPELVDQAVHNVQDIRDVAEAVDGVSSAKSVRTRGSGRTCFIELNIHVPTQNFQEAHSVADRVEDELKHHFGEECTITIHMEPDEDERRIA